MTAFLSPEEVAELTGYRRAADQVRWCTEHDLQAWLNARGQCVVPRDLRPRAGRMAATKRHAVQIQDNW